MSETQQLGTARTHDELVDLLAARKEALGLSNAFIDARWDYAAGMTDKYLGPTRIKTLGRQSLDDLMQVLGVSLVLVEDMAKVRQEANGWEQRKRGYAHSPRVSKSSIERAKPVVFKQFSEIGNAARKMLLPRKEQIKIARKAARARARLPKARRSEISRKGWVKRRANAKARKAIHACPEGAGLPAIQGVREHSAS